VIGPTEAVQGGTVNTDDAGLGKEDPVALLPHLGGEAVLAGLGGGEGEPPHRDGPGNVRGPGHLAAGEPLPGIADVADLAPARPGHRHVHLAGADRLAVVQRIEDVVEIGDLEVLEHPRRPAAARRDRERPVRDASCPEQPAGGDAGVEVVNLIGADRPLKDVKSKEAERRVEMLPVERDVLPGHEPVVDVEGQPGVGAGTNALNVAHPREAVEIGDRDRLADAPFACAARASAGDGRYGNSALASDSSSSTVFAMPPPPAIMLAAQQIADQPKGWNTRLVPGCRPRTRSLQAERPRRRPPWYPRCPARSQLCDAEQGHLSPTQPPRPHQESRE